MKLLIFLGEKNLDTTKMDDYTPEVSCSVPLLLDQDAIDTNCSKPDAPILLSMTYSDKNVPNNETSTGLQKGNVEKYCVTHENELHNSTCTSKINNNTKSIHSIQHEMELSNDSSGHFPGTSHYKKPVDANVDMEAYFKEPETTPYLSHNTFQNTELEQVKIETNSSGVGMSLSDGYVPATVIYNNSSSGFSSHDKLESCVDNDSYNDDSLDSRTVECLQLNFNTNTIHQNKRNNAQSSSESGTRYSMQNGEGSISICPTKNVPQLSNIKHNINDGYKTIDEINKIIKPVMNNIDVTARHIIESPTDIIQDQEPEEDSTGIDNSVFTIAGKTEHNIEEFSNIAHLNKLVIVKLSDLQKDSQSTGCSDVDNRNLLHVDENRNTCQQDGSLQVIGVNFNTHI